MLNLSPVFGCYITGIRSVRNPCSANLICRLRDDVTTKICVELESLKEKDMRGAGYTFYASSKAGSE